MSDVKQVIVFRHDLLKGDHALRKGKVAGQCAHASLGALLKSFRKLQCIDQDGNESIRYETEFKKDSILGQWLNGTFTKIVVYTEDETSLIELQHQCEEKGIPCSLITDAGNTEFHGVPTITCLGIGPWFSKELNEITGDLKLL